MHKAIRAALSNQQANNQQTLSLADFNDLPALLEAAGKVRDIAHPELITYSRKVFIPLTQLCRDVCHYCTFAQVPRTLKQPYMSLDEVLETATSAAQFGCREALFTLGEKPELRYKIAQEVLARQGYASTLEYLAAAAELVLQETGLLPHLNPGTMTTEELKALKPLAPSMGIMLESASERLTQKGMPHYGSPDKVPEVRLDTLRRAGKEAVPFTTGILIGIGETRLERIESLLKLRTIHNQYGHIQEIIIQNFRAKPDTKMAKAPEPDLNELLWTIAVARILFGAAMNIQAPPNLSPGVLPKIVAAGINDWGGVSPISPDFVNPEAPWPHLDQLAQATKMAGKQLAERLTIYPEYAKDVERWVAPELRTQVLQSVDGEGYPRVDSWLPGAKTAAPKEWLQRIHEPCSTRPSAGFQATLDQAAEGNRLSVEQIVTLFQARAARFDHLIKLADKLRQMQNGNQVSFVVNRNINYTNICYFKCQFCAFSKGKLSENLRGKPYNLDRHEIQRRVSEAWQRGATEVCMQGGIHPQYTGQTYLDILAWVREAAADMHIHAFSPLEVWQGAATLNMPLRDFLLQLKANGLGTLPGTAAEVLDDEVRAHLCPDKINAQEWLTVMRTAHEVGLKTTATIMYGHIEQYNHWARHLLKIRDLQVETGGFTEFVPLPFVHMEAPIYLKGKARRGPTFREAVLMHAIARIVLHPHINNIQAGWVKMGHEGVQACLAAGCNDLGGTLMNESITRAAGAAHGEETSPKRMHAIIVASGRTPVQRTTLYQQASQERIKAGLDAHQLIGITNTPVSKLERDKHGKRGKDVALVRSEASG